jgi:hypothetical protein
LDAGFGIAAAVDGVLLGAFTGVAVAERVLPLGSDNATGSAGAAVAVDVAVAVDAGVPVGAAGSVDVGVPVGAAGAGAELVSGSAIAADGGLLDPIIEVAGAELVLPLGLDPTFVLMLAVVAGVAVGVAEAVDAGVPVGAAGSVDVGVPVGAAGSVDVGVAVGAAGSGKLASLGGGIAITVAALFSGTVSEVEFSVKPAGVVTNGVLLGPITRVAVADAVLLAGSDTVKANVELVPKLSSVGLNFRPVSCATVRVSPRVTGVMPSASSTVPSEGNAVTVTTKADEAKLVSVGAGIAIGVAKLFSATVSDFELAVSDMAYSTAELFATR